MSTTLYPLGRLRVRPVASEPSHTGRRIAARATWRRVSWRTGTKGRLQGHWTALRVRVADGEVGRKGEHMPGELVCLVGEQ